MNLDFTFIVAIFENPAHPEKMIEIVFRYLITEKEIRNIFIDGEKPKWYEHKLKKVLRDKGIPVKKLKTVRSKSHTGIQLADAIAGLVRRYYNNPEEPDAKKWFKRFKQVGKLEAQFFFESEAVDKLLSKQ